MIINCDKKEIFENGKLLSLEEIKDRNLGCKIGLHDWDKMYVLTLSPPKYKCKLCGKTEYCYMTGKHNTI